MPFAGRGIELSGRPSPGWQAAVVGALLAGATALIGWGITRTAWAPADIALGILASIALMSCATLWRGGAGVLRWDGVAWSHEKGGVVRPGLVDVTIDLGSWMLLRFRPEAGARRRQTLWWPVGKASSPADWHALRRAVYSPRPAGGASAAADLPSLPQ